jgi:hypothetical protein
MATHKSKPGAIHLRIIEVMKRFPKGISGGQIREELSKEGLQPDEQTHLDRRKRDLKKWFVIEKSVVSQIVSGKTRKIVLYRYVRERTEAIDEGDIGIKSRAAVIHAAHGRCEMCGRTIAKDAITLVVDHKKPRDWGGTNDRSNLWAICEECNAGKKAHFSSLDIGAELMRKVMASPSVHVRIGELLKAFGVGARTPSWLLEFVADQDDWHKRLRELRYPVIGWEIETRLYKEASGRKRADYILRESKEWPENPTALIRKYEQEREQKNNLRK